MAQALGCDITKRIMRGEGKVRYIRCFGAPVVEDGTLQRIVGTTMDVTEHELLTQELRRGEAYLAEAQRLSHTGSFGWKPDSAEIVWFEETYRIVEYDCARRLPGIHEIRGIRGSGPLNILPFAFVSSSLGMERDLPF
jgi:hypothetical protein